MLPYYQDERHGITLYCGDCRDVLPTLEGVDHVITDPPYARDIYQRMSLPNTKKGSTTPERIGLASTFSLDNGSRLGKLAAGEIGAIDEMLPEVAAHIARLTVRWAVVYSDVETCWAWRLELEGPMRYVRTGAWVKTDPMPQFTGDRPAVGFEPCTIVHALGPMRWNGGGHAAVWTGGTAKADRPNHPCPKPLWLMRAQVEDFTDPGELILDPFAGSGTTLVAAKQLGRRAIGVELEERWCEVAARRLEAQTPPLFVEADPAPEQGAMQLEGLR